MKKALLFIVLAVLSCQIVKAQDANKPFVHCLVLDNTLSMTGCCGYENIWSEVQDYCYSWVDGIPESSTILFYTFAQNLSNPVKFMINSDTDRNKVKESIRNVNVDGLKTHIVVNLLKVIDYLNENYTDYNKRIYLITDGVNEDEYRNEGFSAVLQKLGSWQGDYNHLYYVDLLGQLDQKAPKTYKDIEEDSNADVISGMTEIVTMRVFDTIPYVLGVQQSFEQYFSITNGKVFDGLSFDFRVADNVVILPSKNITIDNLIKVEEGLYKQSFTLSFPNNSEKECDINVELVGRNSSSHTIVFEPGSFCIQVRNKTKGKVEIKEINGKKGWN